VLDVGQDRTNPFAAARGDKMAMRILSADMDGTTSCEEFLVLHMSAVLDIPYRGRSDDDVNIDTLKYVDAGTVNVVVSTSRTARYGETRQMATHVDAAAASALRTTTMSFSSMLLLAVTALQQV